jgi:NAD(P)H-hydrate repair Nnr-like enzyme with NAD(P)H-hydrate dehydratase domain
LTRAALIASPTGMLSSQDDGPSWLATAGSGDVLAGIAGALMATGVGAMDAGAMAALVHGLAGPRIRWRSDRCKQDR